MTISNLHRKRPVAGMSPASATVMDLDPAAAIIYPETDGEPLAEGTAQYVVLTETVTKLADRYRERLDVAVIGNMLVYYEEGNNKASVAPDVFVVFGVENHPRRSYLTWVEGKGPDFVLEVASISTWREDEGYKRDVYARMGVAEYWRFDPTPDSSLMMPPLIGERLEAGAYELLRIQAHCDREWRGYSALLGLEFRAGSGQLELYDPETQTQLLNYERLREEHQMAEARAQEEAARRRDAETRAQRETARRRDAETRAQQEAARRQAAETHVRDLEEELRRLRHASA